jgi:hypothetical protein
MKIEKLNDIMNCQCLQSIINNDRNKHTIESERFGCKTIQTPNENSEIIFECLTSYRSKSINLNTNRTEKDRNEQDYCGVPFIYCPICGCKTKLDIPTESFYAQFQK